MSTLHILRSDPDEQVCDLIRVITPGDSRQIALYEAAIDYDQLVAAIFNHDRVISWW